MKACIKCESIHSRRSKFCSKKCTTAHWYIFNKHKELEQKKKYHKANKDKIQSYIKKWREDNREHVAEYNRLRYIENKDYILNRNKEYDRKNQKCRNAAAAKYRAKKLNATPKWLNNKQLKQIKELYNNCPEGHHVDHIIPLQGKIVSGLHVPWNLQILIASDNISKSNKVE